MTIKNETENKNKAFTVRFDKRLSEMLEYLQEKKMLSKSSIVRLSIAELYDKTIRRDINNDKN